MVSNAGTWGFRPSQARMKWYEKGENCEAVGRADDWECEAVVRGGVGLAHNLNKFEHTLIQVINSRTGQRVVQNNDLINLIFLAKPGGLASLL